jgi:hypothetical protein
VQQDDSDRKLVIVLLVGAFGFAVVLAALCGGLVYVFTQPAASEVAIAELAPAANEDPPPQTAAPVPSPTPAVSAADPERLARRTPGLYYTFDNGSVSPSRILSVGPAERTGTAAGAVLGPGRRGQALHFRTAGAVAHLPTWRHRGASYSIYSLAFWFRCDGSGVQPLLEFSDDQHLGLRVWADFDAAALRINPGTTRDDVAMHLSADGLHPSRWHHVVITYEDHAVTLYVDGTQRAARRYMPFAPRARVDVPLTIGRGRAPAVAGRQLSGAVDELLLYAAALTSGEVAALAGGAVPESAVAAAGTPRPVVQFLFAASDFRRLGTGEVHDRAVRASAGRHWRGITPRSFGGAGFAWINGIEFDGRRHAISWPIGSCPATPQAFSVTLWLRPAADRRMPVLAFDDAAGSRVALWVDVTDDLLIAKVRSPSGAAEEIAGEATMTRHKWQHLGIAVGDGRVALVHNGRVVGSGAPAASLAAAAAGFVLGADNPVRVSARFAGTMGDFQLFDRALSAEEMAAVFAQRSPDRPPRRAATAVALSTRHRVSWPAAGAEAWQHAPGEGQQAVAPGTPASPERAVVRYGFDRPADAAQALQLSDEGVKWTEGIVGDALLFHDDRDPLVALRDSPEAPCSIAAWVRFDRVDQAVVFGNNVVAQQEGFGLAVQKGHISLRTGNRGAGTRRLTFEVGRWYHIQVAFREDNWRSIYVDGQRLLKGQSTLKKGQAGVVLGGALEAGWQGWAFHGAVDELVFFDGELSAAEARAWYERYER